ncbi:hypothetical protein DERP_003303 [Dermatophagoides pteronyssinus]|uniref:Telomere length and silencing protein 1 homolog n=1 Tax=Dermatophagoides pteronyssinus TaxID=6956 RepID=A0ABQ8JJ42_DERPT|nr:hypothetical protein DERP_003303 [Dermatophagoides pteronyssinus]
MDDNQNNDNDETSTNKTIVFKKRKRKIETIKTIKIDDDDDGDNDSNTKDDDSIDWTTLDELRELQKARKRITKGIDVMDLLKHDMTTTKKNDGEKIDEKKSFGLTDSKTLLANELDLGNTFSLETNRRDEDAEMMKYVDEELAKRRSTITNENNGRNEKALQPADLTKDLLIKAIPDHLLELIYNSKSKNEEMLSSQMLSGIPEVDLGIEERIKNIEKTETAKNKLIEKRVQREMEKLADPNSDQNNPMKDLSFAPKNLASCFNYRQNNLLTTSNNSGNNSMPNHRFNLHSMPTENNDLISHFIDKEERKTQGKSHHRDQHQQQPVQQYDIEPVVVIGDEPLKVRLPKPMEKDNRMPGKDKPLDNYMFEKFKKHIKKR